MWEIVFFFFVRPPSLLQIFLPLLRLRARRAGVVFNPTPHTFSLDASLAHGGRRQGCQVGPARAEGPGITSSFKLQEL